MWRHYRGGRTHPISVMNLADYSVEKLPWTNSNDASPAWVGNTIYFLSDRDHTVNLFSYRVDTKQLAQITHHEEFDGFPMLSPDGRHLVWASNRGNSKPGETNLFLADWKN